MQDVWNRFLQQLVLARAYQKPYELAQRPMNPEDALPGPENPVLEELLPSLLYVRLISILDEGLSNYIEEEAIAIKGKQDLYDRIEAIGERLPRPAALHSLRERRRNLAHESAARCTWDDLEAGVMDVQEAFEQLGLVGTQPYYEVNAEWSAHEVDPPTIERHGPAVIETTAVQEFTVGIKDVDGSWVDKYSWYTATNLIRAAEADE